MVHYSKVQNNQIKEEIRTGKEISVIARKIAKDWKKPYSAIYCKVWRVSKTTRRIQRPAIIDKNPLPDSLISKLGVKDVTKDIIDETPIIVDINQEVIPAEIGIEVPVNSMNFIGVPSKIVVYSNHVRYYFDN
jgi:hypothetical protein